MEDIGNLKKDDSYYFSIPFEYINKNYGNDNYDIDIAYMSVNVIWDNLEQGYMMYYSCCDENLIKSEEGNSDLEGFWEHYVQFKVRENLNALGIIDEAICPFARRG